MLPIIVSAYIDLNRNSDGIKSIKDYLEYSSPLLNLDHPKIIFLEPHVIDQIFHYHPSTQLIPFDTEDLFFKLQDIKLPKNINPQKDTIEYFSVQLNKTDWIIKASEYYPENNQFIWVDFGISHICPNIDFSKFRQQYDNIRIPGCWDPRKVIGTSMDSPNWSFCGGLFGGNIDRLREFDAMTKLYASELIESGKITWEVNIWKLIYDDYPHWFDWYYADHDCGMINNY